MLDNTYSPTRIHPAKWLCYFQSNSLKTKGESWCIKAQCGYDWRKPGNIDQAISIWSLYLPRQIRAMRPVRISETANER